MRTETNSPARSRSPARLVPAILLIVAAALPLASCKGNEDLKRLFTIEGRSAVGAPPQSIEELKKGIALYSKEAERVAVAGEKVGIYYKLLASRYLEKLMFGEAYDALVKAIEYYPGDAALYYRAGVCAGFLAKSKTALGPDGAAERNKYLATAESCYLSSLDSDPRNTQALYGLAVLYEFELDRPAEALPRLKALLEIDTKNVDAMLLLGRVYYRLGRLEDALNAYETVASITKVKAKREAAEENRRRILEETNAQ